MIKDIFYSDKYDNKIAVISGEISYTYKDLKEFIRAQIKYLSGKSENVVISGDDNFNFIIQFLAAIFADKNIYLVTDKKILQDFDKDFYIAEKLSDNTETNYAFPHLDIYKPRVHLYTSGSSGTPKTILKSIYNMIVEAEDIIDEFDLRGNDYIIATTTTMCHMFGLTMNLLVPLCGGFRFNLQRIFYPENVEGENLILITSPTFLNMGPKHNFEFVNAPKYIMSAGGKLDNAVYDYFKHDNINIVDIYGSSETGVVAYRTAKNSMFQTFKNVVVEAGDDDIKVVSNFCYEHIYRVNDKIEMNGKYFSVKNRTDRMLKIYEKRVSAPALEDKLKLHSFVNDSYIFKYAEKLVCICALSEAGQEYVIKNSTADLTKLLKFYMKDFFEIVPQKWKYIDEIPMTITGKIDKYKIEKIFNINISFPIIFGRKIEENSVIYKIFFHKNCNFFKGHFPEYPIVPGVVQIYLAKELANLCFNIELGVGQWKRIKFANVIKQNSIVYLKLEYNKKNVTYEYYSEELKFSSGSFLCENIFKESVKL